MQALVYNIHGSNLHQRMEALTLKLGYLLSTEVCTAGSSCHDMHLMENLTEKSLFEKLSFIEHASKYQPKFLKEVKTMKAFMKKMRNGSCKTPKQHDIRKEGEQLIDVTFQGIIKLYQETIFNYGFREVKELSKDECFVFAAMNKNPEDASGDNMLASHLLQRLLYTETTDVSDDKKEDNEPELFLLGAEFLRDDYSKPPIYNHTDKRALNPDTIYLYRAFKCEGIHHLQADELRTLRSNIAIAKSAFCDAMNEWMDMCYFNDDVADRLSFFHSHIIPAAMQMQQALDEQVPENDNQCLDKEELPIEVWIGEMPVSQLWKFYRDQKAITDTTWRKLEQEKELQKERWPIMMLSVPEACWQSLLREETFEEPEEEMEEDATEEADKIMRLEPLTDIKPTKKYLIID